jgi:hypothetical protein
MPGSRFQSHYSKALSLSGLFAGEVRSVAGGNATADVIEEKLPAKPVVQKYLAGVRYTDLELQCDAGMERTFFDWIQDTLACTFTRKSGAISFLDLNGQERSRLEFVDALVTAIVFPALDTALKDHVRMAVKLSPDSTRRQQGSGGQAAPASQLVKGKATWTSDNFRLTIDGLGDTPVTKIEPLIVQTVVAEQVGASPGYQTQPVYLDVSDLVVTLIEDQAATFYAWHEDFVIRGLNDPQYERNGTLELFGPNRMDVLLTLELRNLGIFNLSSVSSPSVDGRAQTVRASMYCEEIRLASPSVAAGAAAPPTGAAAGAAAPPTGAAAGAAAPPAGGAAAPPAGGAGAAAAAQEPSTLLFPTRTIGEELVVAGEALNEFRRVRRGG